MIKKFFCNFYLWTTFKFDNNNWKILSLMRERRWSLPIFFTKSEWLLYFHSGKTSSSMSGKVSRDWFAGICCIFSHGDISRYCFNSSSVTVFSFNSFLHFLRIDGSYFLQEYSIIPTRFGIWWIFRLLLHEANNSEFLSSDKSIQYERNWY